MKELSCFSFVSITIACFLCVCDRTLSANILYMSTTPAPSHNIWDKTLAIALRDRGHQLTYVSHDRGQNSNNFTTIHLEGVYETLVKGFDLETKVDTSTTENILLVFEWVYISCQMDLQTKGLQEVLKLAKDGKKFDLIIQDVTTGFCFSPIAEIFDYPPLVGTSPFGIHPYLSDNFAIDLQTSYIPQYALKYSGKMNFKERIINYFTQMYELSLKYYYWGKIKGLLDEFYGRDMKHIYEIERNFSIMLPNYDPILDYSRPLPPDVIPVGGLHMKRSKPLPQDLQTYLDNSKEGVIIFSLGTNVRSNRLKAEKKKILIETFAQLKQNIIWKFESDISDLPKNVIVRRFLPQYDILAHPNVRLIINHGGALSSQESIYQAVPQIIVPFFADQRSISQKIIHKKIGLSLNLENLTVDYMLTTIREVINNPIYKENVKELSRIYRDRPESALNRAVFWVEHVLRQRGAKYFNLPARQMPFYQTQLLDIWFLIVATLILAIIVIEKVCCKFSNSLKSTEKAKLPYTYVDR